jgi:DNA ligase (NAD+)
MESLVEKISDMDVDEAAKYISKAPLTQLNKLRNYLDNQFYTKGGKTVPDHYYDMLEETLKDRDPDFEDRVGASVGDNEKAELPFYLGSMPKIKSHEEKKLVNWLKKNPVDNYFVSSKLNGVSCLAVYSEEEPVRLYTRGDGVHGGDISWVAKLMPKSIPYSMEINIAIRGEIVMPDSIFDKKYSKDYANALAMTTGLLGSNKATRPVNDLHFVAYEVLYHTTAPGPEEQFKTLVDEGFEVALHTLTDEISVDSLTDYLISFREKSKYDLDGLVVQTNKPFQRKNVKYPSYAFAFKIPGITQEAKVEQVTWSMDSRGNLVPRVWVQPIKVSGITVEKTTAHNAKFIYTKSIGPGAIVQITRSGEIIPNVIGVVKPAKDPEMPSIPWKWGKGKVHILPVKIAGKVALEMGLKIVFNFFHKLKVNGIGKSTVATMNKNGLQSIVAILSATEDEICEAIGSKANGKKIYANIRTLLTNPDIPLLVGSTPVLGEGIGRKLTIELAEKIPNIFVDGPKMGMKEIEEKVGSLEGFGTHRAAEIARNISWGSRFAEILKELTIHKKEKAKKKVDDSLKGEVFVVTGFTDTALGDEVTARGGVYTTSWGKGVTGLIVSKKSMEKKTKKIEKAEDAGIPVYSLEEFRMRFLK